MANTCKDFTAGEAVSYVPHHAKGDRGHPDVEHGVVTSENGHYVFVRFGAHLHSQACDPETLVHQFKRNTEGNAP